MADELKPCPFCGDDNLGHKADCYLALCVLPDMPAPSVMEAAWNRRALSHAAGQDSEQCRAGAGEPVAWIRPDGVTTSDAGLMRHWEAQGLQFEPLVRALSRGVPEDRDGERYRAQFDERGRWDYSDAWIDETKEKVDAMIDAAIAAQRKEGE